MEPDTAAGRILLPAAAARHIHPVAAHMLDTGPAARAVEGLHAVDSHNRPAVDRNSAAHHTRLPVAVHTAVAEAADAAGRMEHSEECHVGCEVVVRSVKAAAVRNPVDLEGCRLHLRDHIGPEEDLTDVVAGDLA